MTENPIEKAAQERDAYAHAVDPQQYSPNPIPTGYEAISPSHIAGMADADREHAVNSALAAELENLRAEVRALQDENKNLKKPDTNESTISGGEPVSHHLHLVDGRVIQAHSGIATHYSETDANGNTVVTRVRSYYPANEPDPALKYL